MAKTTVVNVRSGEPFDVYMGRRGPFGNPYVLGPDGDREEVIRKFKIYFYERLKLDSEWKTKVEALRGKILACHCHPLSCHSDVYVAYLDQ